MTTIRTAAAVLLVLHIAYGQSALRDIRRIYIGEISGNAEKLAQERLTALLTNTGGRFVVTEEKDKADAVLTGVVVAKDGISFGAIPVNGSIAARGGTFTHVDLVLRLVGKNSETIWAYDGTKRCYDSVTRCAIDQLVKDAKKKTK
jgi:hypothetical protein